MATLVQAALTVRRSARAGAGNVVALGLLALIAYGRFDGGIDGLSWPHAIVGLVWGGFFVGRLRQRLEQDDAAEGGARLDFEVGLLALAGVHALAHLTGGLSGPLGPLVYVVVAIACAFARPHAGALLAAVAAGIEVAFAFRFAGDAEVAILPLAARVAFIATFGGMNLVLTRAEIARVRARSRAQLDEDRERVRMESRMFRLSAPATRTSDAPDVAQLEPSSVEEVRHALYHVLHLVHRALDLHTCVLLMREGDDGPFRIAEMVSDADAVAHGPFKGGEGAVGAVVKRGAPMRLENLKSGYKGLCYYEGTAPVRAFVGIPIVERGHVAGVLCADRIVDRPFTARDEDTLGQAARQAMRAMTNERVFIQVERSKQEQTILHRASQALGAALDEDAVLAAGLEAAGEFAPFDFAAITVYDADAREHRIAHAEGEKAERFLGKTFKDNTSLTAMVVKNRHYLPYRGEYEPGTHVVFTKRLRLDGMRSLLILPLIVREDAVGTVILAAARKDAFGANVRSTLTLLSNQLAVSLANAHAVKRLEEMATTDGLTGCLNKRTFNEKLEEQLAGASRFGRKLSLLVTDIDHFKSVNDTYGHATGDVVIKELGHILNRLKRETDIVSRFGGEEFCVLCEETDTEGAFILAERIREEVEATIFKTELGDLQVTASLGVATFPEHASTAHGLFEITDKALYEAKNNGRNQVRSA